MHSFVRGAARQRFPKLQDRDDLWRILVTITARKAVRFKRRRMADKRGGGQVRGESIFVAAGDGANFGLADVLKAEPSAELAVETAEMFRVLYANLKDPLMEQVVLARIEGYTVPKSPSSWAAPPAPSSANCNWPASAGWRSPTKRRRRMSPTSPCAARPVRSARPARPIAAREARGCRRHL